MAGVPGARVDLHACRRAPNRWGLPCRRRAQARRTARDGSDLAARGKQVHREGENADVECEGGEAMEGDDLADTPVGHFDVRRRERHPAGEGEVDEIPIDGLRGSRETEASATGGRLN